MHLAGPGSDPFPGLPMAMQVARNALAELPDVAIEIVVQGPSVRQLIPGAEPLENVARGITVYACENSLRSAGMESADLQPNVEVVPAAVSHIATRQFQGAAYIRL